MNTKFAHCELWRVLVAALYERSVAATLSACRPALPALLLLSYQIAASHPDVPLSSLALCTLGDALVQAQLFAHAEARGSIPGGVVPLGLTGPRPLASHAALDRALDDADSRGALARDASCAVCLAAICEPTEARVPPAAQARAPL